MSITTAIRAWFTKEVLGRLTDVESKIESVLAAAGEKEAELQAEAAKLISDASATVAAIDLDALKAAVIASVLAELKADGVQITEALLEKYGVPAIAAKPVAETVVQAAESAIEAAE